MQLRVRRSRPGPRPDLAPGVAGDQILEVGGERRRPLDRGVDVLVAEHLAADLHAAIVRLVAHAPLPRRRRARDRRTPARRRGTRRGRERARPPPRSAGRPGGPAGTIRCVPPRRRARAPSPGRRARRAETTRARPSAARSMFAPHAVGVDLEPAKHLPRSRRPRRPRTPAPARAAPTPPASAPSRALVLLRRAAPCSTAAAPCACARAGDASAEPTGLRLCGIVEEPPRPAGSRTSPTSVCDRSATSSADLGEDARRDAERERRARRSGPRLVCHGTTGSTRSSSPRSAAQHLEPAVAERGERAGRAAELDREARRRESRPAAAARSTSADEPAGGLQPEGGRHGLLQQRPAGHRRRPVASRARPAQADGRAVELGQDEAQRAAGDEHRRRVHDVLARRAVVDAVGGVAADALAQRPHERLGRVPGRARLDARARRRRSGSARHAARRSPRRPPPGSRPRAPRPAPARARSRASPAATPRPETASRSSSGTKIASKVTA